MILVDIQNYVGCPQSLQVSEWHFHCLVLNLEDFDLIDWVDNIPISGSRGAILKAPEEVAVKMQPKTF